MPVKRRKAKALNDYPDFTEDRPVSFERWQRHRERLLAYYRPGKRPPEWWAYESPVPRDPDFDVPECGQLYAVGELSDEELKALLPDWKRNYDRAQRPKVFHCLGPDKFLTGRAARLAIYKWAGIPAEYIRRWDRERIPRS